MRLSEEKRANVVTSLRANEHGDKPDYAGYPLRATALDLADELELAYEAVSVREADLIRQADELAELRRVLQLWQDYAERMGMTGLDFPNGQDLIDKTRRLLAGEVQPAKHQVPNWGQKAGKVYLCDADELAAAQRREKRLKRQVELMGWLIQSHETDIHELAGYAKVRGGWPSFDQMGDPSDEGEYTDDDLDMLKDHWPAAADELLRRQMAADWPTGETMQEIDARENPR